MKLIQKASRFLRFSSSKYFHDEKYTNLSLYSENKIGSLSHIAELFSKMGIDMVFVKSQFCNAWTEKKKYMLNVSILHQNQEKLRELEELLSTYGV